MQGTRGAVAAARGAIAAGDLRRAADIATAAVAEIGPGDSPRDRGELLRVRTQLLMLGVTFEQGLVDSLAAEAQSLATQEPVLAAAAVADLAVVAAFSQNDPRAGLARLSQAQEWAAGDEETTRLLSLVTAAVRSYRGDRSDLGSVAPDAVDPFAGSITESVTTIQWVVYSLATAERYDAATTLSARAVAAARRTGALGVLPLLLCLLANSAYFTGDYDTAQFAAGEALDLAGGTGQPAVVVFAAACLALVASVRGDAAQVAEQAGRVRELIPSAGMDTFANTVLVAKGLLALGAPDHLAAIAVYDELATSLGHSDRVSGVVQWRGDRIEALHRAGRSEAARRALDSYAADVAGLDLPWSRTVIARCEGLLADDGWEEHFAAAVAAHPVGMSGFELGRTELCWAQRLCDADRHDDAREHAARALACFEAAEARPWAAAAQRINDHTANLASRARLPGSTAVEIRAFGPLTVVRSGVEYLVPYDVSGKLLRYLVAMRGRAATETAVEMLWPDAAPGTGTTRLRNVLWRLRQQWGDVVVRNGAWLHWAPQVSVDAARFEAEATQALRDGDVELAGKAATRYRGELLPAARYDDWSTARRERLRGMYVDLLRLQADGAGAGGDVDRAIRLLEAAILADPHEEGHYLRAAQLLLDGGRPGAARRFLDRAAAANDDLGVQPSADLRRLRAAVQLTS